MTKKPELPPKQPLATPKKDDPILDPPPPTVDEQTAAAQAEAAAYETELHLLAAAGFTEDDADYLASLT